MRTRLIGAVIRLSLVMIMLLSLLGCVNPVDRGDTVIPSPWGRIHASEKRQDHATALRERHFLAQQGDVMAQCQLGVMYYEGKGVAQDHAEAIRWFRQAATQDVAQAQAKIYQDMGVSVSHGATQGIDAEAQRLSWQLAIENIAQAQGMLGAMYGVGHGVPQDFTQALHWNAKAIENSPPGEFRTKMTEIRDVMLAARDRVARQPAASQTTAAPPTSPSPSAPVSASPAPPPATASSPAQAPTAPSSAQSQGTGVRLRQVSFVRDSVANVDTQVLKLLTGAIWLLSRPVLALVTEKITIILIDSKRGLVFHEGDEIPVTYVSGASVVEKGLLGSVVEVMGDGAILRLNDDSLWEVPSYDRFHTSFWLPPYPVLIPENGLSMVNLKKGKRIWVKRVH